MSLRIDIVTNDGSPLNISEATIYGEDSSTGQMGVGGAELALLTMCREWHHRGDKVRLYNNPSKGDGSSFPQLTLDQFRPEEDRDVLIVFRSPTPLVNNAKGKRVWWSCDQYTVGDFRAFANSVEKIVTISKHHSNYFKTIYGIEKTIPIDLPVRTWEYRDKIDTVSKRCIFTSMPDRGIMPLHAAWALISREVPDASLVITSDWRLWTPWASADQILPYRLQFAMYPNVTYMGAVNRRQLIQEQMKSELFIYPCTYEELFCIAASEAQVAGAYPITSGHGALPTTNMGTVLTGDPTNPQWMENFVRVVVENLKDEKLIEKRKHIQELAVKRFSPANIVSQWDRSVFDA